MTDLKTHKTLVTAINKYGIPAQTDMAIEEMSELTKAILKRRRAQSAMIKTGDRALITEAEEAIREEIADVEIMLAQLKIIYGDTTEHYEAKVARLGARITGGDNS